MRKEWEEIARGEALARLRSSDRGRSKRQTPPQTRCGFRVLGSAKICQRAKESEAMERRGMEGRGPRRRQPWSGKNAGPFSGAKRKGAPA
jgi:hypothetical protein